MRCFWGRCGRMAEVCVALLTPFTAAGDVAYDALETHVEHLVAEGVTSLMPCGTTGEGVLLDDGEIVAILTRVSAVVGGRARIIAHVGRASTRATVALASTAETVGIGAVSAVAPYYYKYSDDQIRAHYLALLRAVSVPVYAYTIPDRDGNVLSPAVVRTLAAAGLGGVKDSSKSLDRHREYLACGVDVLMGSDTLVLDALRLGAAGTVSAIANVEPRWLLELARHASRDTDAATSAQARIDALRERTRASTSVIAALKRELALRLPGYPTHVRPPLS